MNADILCLMQNCMIPMITSNDFTPFTPLLVNYITVTSGLYQAFNYGNMTSILKWGRSKIIVNKTDPQKNETRNKTNITSASVT